MLADIASRFIKEHGQQVEIRRAGAVVAETKCLPHEGKTYLSFLPGTDVRAGDEVYFKISEKLYTVQEAEKEVIQNKISSVKAHFLAPPRHGQPLTVHGNYFAGNVSHSALQVNSPNATQTVTIGADQKDKAKEVIRLVLEVLDELDLAQDDKDEVTADAESAQRQIDSPKTKWQHVKDYFKNIRGKVASSLSGKIADGVVAKGGAAVQAIDDYLSTAGA